jgi:hypothetical protein
MNRWHIPLMGRPWVIRRALNIQIKEDDVDQRWENIFHTQCYIQNKICSMITRHNKTVRILLFI